MKKFKYIATILLLLHSFNLYAEPCGSLSNPSGPYDYTDVKNKDTVALVEYHHFSKNVENLISGETASIGGDLSFVLIHIPNHHRALLAMSKLALRDKINRIEDSKYSVLCFFDRAIRFRPNDATVRYLFSGHLLKINNFDMALQQLNIASELEPGNPTFNYNLGLLYFQKKNYDKAVHFAKKAYGVGFPLPGLKNKLAAIGRWKD